MMSRGDFEAELIARLEDIKALYKKYNPKAFMEGTAYLFMSIGNSETIMVNNKYWDHENADYDAPVNCWTDNTGAIHSYPTR
jgi:hypothetical protein